MKIARVESLHADAGQRNFDFLKITTDDGLVGWSEYNESFGGVGVSAVIDGLAPQIIGRDPRAYEALVALLYAVRDVLTALRDQLAAFREWTGPDVDLLVDLNFNFKTEGFLKVARSIEPFDIFWVEIDTRDPKALHDIRRSTRIPVASCECLFGRRDYRPYFEARAVDVAI